MPERLLKILLSELGVVRVTCLGTRADGQACQAVFEFPLEKLKGTFYQKATKDWACPFCATVFAPDPTGHGSDPFAALVQAVTQLHSIKDRMSVQFIIPQKD